MSGATLAADVGGVAQLSLGVAAPAAARVESPIDRDKVSGTLAQHIRDSAHGRGHFMPTSPLDPNIAANLREATNPNEVTDRQALKRHNPCHDQRSSRHQAEANTKALAALLPEIGALKPESVCARKRLLAAGYSFR